MRAISISIIKNTVRSIVLLGTSIAMGTVLLCLVYMLPMAPIKRHVFEDVKLLQGEGNYTVFWEGTFVRMHPNNISIETFFLNNRGMARDNYTDAIMLGNAAYEDESKSIPEKALCVYRYAKENEMPIDSLQVYLENGRIDSEISYSRYWHGYLVFLKPLLCFFTYVQIRIINVLLQSVLLVFLCRETVRKIGGEYATSLFGAVLMVFPFAIPFCMQYCTAVYVMLVSSIIYLRHYGYWSRKERTLYYFMMTGIVTSYVDFLTYPLITLGTLLVISALTTGEKNWFILKHSFMWCVGYFGMWAGKWVLATVATGENVIRDGITQMIFRTSSTTDTSAENEISAIKAVFANFSSMTNIYYIFVFFLLVLFLAAVMKRQDGYKIKDMVGQRHFLWIAFLPIIWYCVVKNHSYDHSSFTYRALFVTIFALMTMVVRSCEKIDGSDSDYLNKK